MLRLLVVASVVLSALACTTRGPTALSQRELQALGTHVFDAPFDEVFDATFLTLERHEGKVSQASRIEGVMESDKAEFTAPAGWDGTAYRSYAASVYQQGAQVAVTAVPRLWAGERDVSDEPWWVVPGSDGEQAHWERLFDGVQELLSAWREVPELQVEKSRGELQVLGITLHSPADWRGLEPAVDRRSAFAQRSVRGSAGCADCPGGMNPSMVFEVSRRYPAFDAPRLEHQALERALGSKLIEPDAWDTTETPTGRRGTGQVVAGDPSKVVEVVWHVWDARDPTWMVRAAAACGAPASPTDCEAQWDAMINGVTTGPR
ncbi:MAG: hypothetical protein IPJ65_02990 [Archangiaceae bacterium]|nr:hypothetical protein [Archangiaceae bacterium]